MGWTYYDYIGQPTFFTEAVHAYLVQEQKEKVKAWKRSQQQRS